jgi:hypothetical protein
MPHLETYQDFLNWDEEDEKEVTISSNLLRVLVQNKLVDGIDAYALSRRVVDKPKSP